MNRQQGRDQVGRLVDFYETHRARMRMPAFNEAQARQELINPFFVALGWDIDNRRKLPPQNREVIVEGTVQMEGRSKAPDYLFRLGRTSIFYAEAKKPGIDVTTDSGPALQLRRYAWNSKLPVSVLTSFEHLGVFDTSVKPNHTDRPRTALLGGEYYGYKNYLDKWDEIWDLLSREAVWNGSFDRLAADPRLKQGRSPVDEEFLREIESWRSLLASHIAKHNHELTKYPLNDAVQLIIDRIIFLRIAEDRGIEPYEQLQTLTVKKDNYSRLIALCQAADKKYNSGLFDFSNDADTLTPTLTVGDDVLRGIVRSLYPPHSPYEFSVLSASILGQVYEQFLGKVITLEKGHNISIDYKPEVRKAGGIYYTPSYIVNYIVHTTVRPLIQELSPTKLRGFRILDPACGSGSFLLGAYELLLEHYLQWYRKNQPEKKYEQVWHSNGRWRLTVAERKRILLEHIYGVDVDPAAVEVSKLSLLLKVLEGESQQTILQQELFGERALPHLEANIKCGNTLIGPEFYQGRLDLDEDEKRRINPFDWESEFPQVTAAGGFHCVIGNPPYRRERDFKDLLAEVSSTRWGSQYRRPRMDLWYYFVHRGLELLRADGKLSFIVNAYWTSSTGSERLLQTIYEETTVEEIFSLHGLDVFRGVSGNHMMFRLRKGAFPVAAIVKSTPIKARGSAEPYVTRNLNVTEFTAAHELLFLDNHLVLMPPGEHDHAFDRNTGVTPLVQMARVRQGIAENPSSINTRTNGRFEHRFKLGEGVFALKPGEVAALKLPEDERQILKPYFDLKDVGRYYLAPIPSLSLIYSTKQTWSEPKQFPTLLKHLKRFQCIMEERRETEKGSIGWWHLHWPRDAKLWESDKILALQMAERPTFVVARGSCYVPFSTNVVLPLEQTKEHLNYICAVLNSSVLWEWFKKVAKRRGVDLEINGHVLERAPIRRIDFASPDEMKIHEDIVKLVNVRMRDETRIRACSSSHQRVQLQRTITAIEKELEDRIRRLYGIG